MNIERPGSPSATTVAPTSTRRSTSIETKRSRLASERPPKNGVATKNAFRSGELTAIDPIYSHSRGLTAPYRLRLAERAVTITAARLRTKGRLCRLAEGTKRHGARHVLPPAVPMNRRVFSVFQNPQAHATTSAATLSRQASRTPPHGTRSCQYRSQSRDCSIELLRHGVLLGPLPSLSGCGGRSTARPDLFRLDGGKLDHL